MRLENTGGTWRVWMQTSSGGERCVVKGSALKCWEFLRDHIAKSARIANQLAPRVRAEQGK